MEEAFDIIKLRTDYKNSVHAYMNAWCQKHDYFYDPRMWVGDDCGNICMVGDMFVSFNDVRYDIDHDLVEEAFELWYYYALEVGMFNPDLKITLDAYVKGYRPYTQDQIDEIKTCQYKVKQIEEDLKQLISNYKKIEE